MILILDCGSTKTIRFKEIAQNFGLNAQIEKKQNIKRIDFDKYSRIIISGGPTLLTEQKDYYKDFTFVKKISKPILGICLGHQIIGLQFGANIFSYNKISGFERMEIIANDSLFYNLPDNPLFFEDHREYVNLPNDFILLAKSKSCKNEAMKHRSKPIYGFQFHPEISGKNGLQVLQNFFNL